MDDEQDERLREQESERGRQAEELLAHPLITKFFEEMEADLWAKFQATGLRDSEGLLIIKVMTHWLEQFKATLTEHVTTGTMAQLQLAEIREQRLTLRQRLSGRL